MAFLNVAPRSEFVFDDHVLIQNNTDLLLDDVWTQSFGRDYYATSQAHGASGYFRPIAVVSHALDARLWKMHPQGFHFTNLALHVLASLALLAALRAFGAVPGVAWIAAMVFAVHPLHAESVAFISGRVDVLAALGVFLACAAMGSERRGAWLGVGAASFFAFLSKESAVVLPVLLGIVFWARPRTAPESRQSRRARAVASRASHAWGRKGAALAVATIAAVALRHAALEAWLPATAASSRPGLSVFLPLQTFLFGLASAYVPVQALAVEPDPARLVAWRLAAGMVAAAVLWGAAWRFEPAARRMLASTALASIVALLPTLNFLPQETLLSERYLYLASGFLFVPIGVLVMFAWRRGGILQPAGAGAGAILLLVLLGLSSWRSQFWRTDVRVWQRAVLEEPRRAAFWDRLGLALTEKRSFGPAEQALRRAIELDPRLLNSHINLGVLLQSMRQPREAIEAYRRALELQPRHVNAHVNMGMAYLDIRDPDSALAAFRQALEIKPDHPDALRLAGGAAMQTGRLEDARTYLERARQIAPSSQATQRALQRLEEAESQARQPR